MVCIVSAILTHIDLIFFILKDILKLEVATAPGCTVAAGAGAAAGITCLTGGTVTHISGAIKTLHPIFPELSVMHKKQLRFQTCSRSRCGSAALTAVSSRTYSKPE